MTDDCHIHVVPKPRNGKSRYWCVAHEASATARFGGRMQRCEGAYRTVAHYRRFRLDPADFHGGVALWGAVEPVFNTARQPAERGIHVHARQSPSGRKDIDRTFEAVEITIRRDLYNEERVLITAETAVAYHISRFLDRKIVGLFCPRCHTPHLDSDWYAVKPHRSHLCHGCNRLFRQEARRISNPLEMVRHELNIVDGRLGPVRARRRLDIRQADYPGGLQIWASNPALLWTSPRREQQGIHVHGWRGSETMPKLDGTFDEVRVDGLDLNEEQLRVFMIQNALTYLKGKIVALNCPACGERIFHRGEAAFRPQNEHECSACGTRFATPRRRRVVSNPFVATVKALRRLAKQGGRTA